MSAELAVVVSVVVLLVLIAATVPVAFALAAAGVTGLVLQQGGLDVAGSALASLPFVTTARYGLTVVPLFVFMGFLAMEAHIAEDLFAVAERLLRRVRGGLAMATVAACAGFAAVTGSSVATVASIGKMAVREMRRYGFTAEFAAGTVGAAGTLGILIPPSIILVIYGIATGESIGALLLAGILPGIVSALLYVGLILLRSLTGRDRVPAHALAPAAVTAGTTIGPSERPAVDTGAVSGPGDSRADRRTGISLPEVLSVSRIAVLFAIVVGGIYFGYFTVTESAAMGAFAALLMLAFQQRRSVRSLLPALGRSMADTASVTSMAFALLIGGAIFSYFLVGAGVPTAFTRWIVDLPVPPPLIVVLLLLITVPMGMILDSLSILLIVVPIAYPAVTALGYDGVWFGILMVKVIELGLITPPVGLNVFVIAGVADDVTVEQAFRGIAPYAVTDVLTIAMLFAFPQITLLIPSLAA